MILRRVRKKTALCAARELGDHIIKIEKASDAPRAEDSFLGHAKMI